MHAPKGSGCGAQQTVAVYPGNRLSLIVFTMLGVLAAADAGRVDEGRLGEVWLAPEVADCEVAMSAPSRELRFEKIAAGDDAAIPSIVKFAWHPDTGELSFTTQAALTLPEGFVTAASALTSRHCE